MRILVEPEALRALADQMAHAQGRMESLLGDLQNRLERSVRAGSASRKLLRAGEDADNVIQRGREYLNRMDNLTRMLRERAAAFEEADRAGTEGMIRVSASLPPFMISALPQAGGSTAAWWAAAPLVSIPLGRWAAKFGLQTQHWPDWLRRLLGVVPDETEAAAAAVTTLPGESSPAEPDSPEQPTRLGALLEQYEQEMQTAQASAGNREISVPVLAQGDQLIEGQELMGGYGCVPTSVSMVLGYFHARDASNSAQTPTELFNSFDADDWDGSGGMGPHRLVDEVQDLGYQTVETHVNVSFEDLEGDLAKGPVLVTTRVGLQGNPRKVISPNGSNASYHAMVVTGVSPDGTTVYVNDPWGGAALEYDRASFESIWEGGGRGELVIQP